MTRQALRTESIRHPPGDSPPTYVPFVVADRPNHLRIVQDALRDTESGSIGVLTMPHVSETVVEMLAEWPDTLEGRTTLLCDNGAFTEVGTPPIHSLYATYDEMGVDYGLVPEDTTTTARNREVALDAAVEYQDGEHDWMPVAVIHGDTPSEYEDAYRRARHLGYDHVAIGGLLEQSGERSGAHATAGSDAWDVVNAVRDLAPNGWVFTLGYGAASRNPRLAAQNVAGGDSKRWLFQYDDTESRHRELVDYVSTRLLDRTHEQPSLAGWSA